MFLSYLIISLFFFLFQEKNTKPLYIAKNDWHVGIILKIDEPLINNIDAVSNFKYYDYVDIGWGDADFYQSSEDFDLFLASKAILFPTSSVIRVQGYALPIVQIFKYRDYVFELELNDIQHQKLCEFITKSFELDSTNSLIITSQKYNGVVKFFSSVHKYHLFNTYNTWVGEALEFSVFEKKKKKIITAEHLYDDLLRIGKVIKPIQD